MKSGCWSMICREKSLFSFCFFVCCPEYFVQFQFYRFQTKIVTLGQPVVLTIRLVRALKPDGGPLTWQSTRNVARCVKVCLPFLFPFTNTT